MIQSIPDFNIREKARLYVAAKRTAVLMYMQNGYITNSQILKMSRSWNKINEHCSIRTRKQDNRDLMHASRAQGQVFYLCTAHSGCAEDHVEWQGRIYVDRFWRNTLKDDPETLYAVKSYLNNHEIKTVQWVMGPPVFLITRPYCRHRMIPIPIQEVLHGSLNHIQKHHPEYYEITRKGDYRKKFYRLRYEVHKGMGLEAEARRDKILLARVAGK